MFSGITTRLGLEGTLKIIQSQPQLQRRPGPSSAPSTPLVLARSPPPQHGGGVQGHSPLPAHAPPWGGAGRGLRGSSGG